MRKNIIKISLTGVATSVVVFTTFFNVAVSAVPTESLAESTKEYDDLQMMFLEIDKDTTEDDLPKLLKSMMLHILQKMHWNMFYREYRS